MSILTRLFSRNKFPNSEQVIEYAFTCGGERYYQHADEMNMPYRRAMKALVFYNEMEMKCSFDYLAQFAKAFEALIATPKFSIETLVKQQMMINQLKERMNLAFDPDHIYKLASVRYFDEHENPNDYDWKYNAAKIEKWKKEPVRDFFLQKPIRSFIPFLDDAPQDFDTFTRAVDSLNKSNMEFLSEVLSQNPKIASSVSTGPSSSKETKAQSS